MIEGLYQPFQHWGASGTTWILSDTHFNDPDLIHVYADRPRRRAGEAHHLFLYTPLRL